MGILGDLAKGLGKAVLETTASYGEVEHTISELKEASKNKWPGIIEKAYKAAEKRGGNLQTFSQMFAKRLSQMEDEDKRFKGIHGICLVVIAKMGLEHMR